MTPAVTAIVRVGTWTLIGTLAALGLISTGAAIAVPAGVAAGIGAVVGWAVAGQRTPSSVAMGAAAAFVGFVIRDGQLAEAVAEITIAGNLTDMFLALTPADDLQFRRAVDVPTLRIDGMMVAGA